MEQVMEQDQAPFDNKSEDAKNQGPVECLGKMSGGHFDYQDSYLGYIAQQLEEDVEFNDVEYDISKPADAPYGFQHQRETIGFMKFMVLDLYKLKELLREYDLAVSGDSSEQSILEKARLVYRTRREGKC
jgi:hypothetical protein